MSDERELSTWGAGTQRSSASWRDDVVLKERTASSPTVMALLKHYERVGFTAAPTVVGTGFADDGRMALSWAPGESAHPRAWVDAAHPVIGALLRRAHDAGTTFDAPVGASWETSWIHRIGDRDDLVIGHGDAAPWNIVGPDAWPTTLIDWDLAGPIDRLTDVAYAVWLNAQLHDDDIAGLHDLPTAAVRAQSARQIIDGYGLPQRRRADLLERMVQLALAGVRADAVEHGVSPESVGAVSPSGYPVLWSITWRARSAGWMMRNRRLLVNTLTRSD